MKLIVNRKMKLKIRFHKHFHFARYRYLWYKGWYMRIGWISIEYTNFPGKLY